MLKRIIRNIVREEINNMVHKVLDEQLEETKKIRNEFISAYSFDIWWSQRAKDIKKKIEEIAEHKWWEFVNDKTFIQGIVNEINALQIKRNG